MKVKVFTPNHNGKIEFTPAELERLLNEVYEDGQRNCNCNKPLSWITPYYSNNDIVPANKITNNTTTPIDNLKAESVEACNIDRKPFAITIGEEDRKKMSEEFAKLLNANRSLRAHEFNDVFSNLAKELNF
jgi:hypothetical protein